MGSKGDVDRLAPPAGGMKFLLDFFPKKSRESRGQSPLAQPAQGRESRGQGPLAQPAQGRESRGQSPLAQTAQGAAKS